MLCQEWLKITGVIMIALFYPSFYLLYKLSSDSFKLLLPLFLSLIALSTFAKEQNLDLMTYLKEPIHPLPPLTRQIVNVDIIALGKRLFHEKRLSGNDTISCATCHPLDKAGVDNLKVSIGINNMAGTINATTVYNISLLPILMWGGEIITLEEQISRPVTMSNELGSSWQEVIDKLKQDEFYLSEFNRLYTDGITQDNIENAIATYERTLITPDAPFDLFLKGNNTAISKQAKEGYLLFKSYGCSSCHQGITVGGNLYEKMGVMGDYFKDRGKITKADYGRFNNTGKEEHKYQFRVPSLRNVALTAPYFHDGTAETLEQAVIVMAKYQLGRRMKKAEAEKIVDFLNTLTGKMEW